MLRITIKGEEFFDEELNKFLTVGDIVVDFEHSLISLSKWESIHKIPFLASTTTMSKEQLFDYLYCMVITPDVPKDALFRLSQENLNELQAYINADPTATTFREAQETSTGPKENVSSELIYYWMVAFQIPFEAERWHLSRLLALVKICNVKNSKPKKRSPSEMRAERARINAERQAKYQTRG